MNLAEQELIKAHFERLYREGIKPWTEHGFEALLAEFLKVLKKVLPGGARILDLGCGDGWIALKAAQEGFAVWGIDSSETAISEAKAAAKRAGLQKRVRFDTGDALALPYEDGFFDALFDRGLLHHILPENRSLYFANILRVLKKNAFAYLSVFSGKNPDGIGQRFSKELVTELFGTDFEIVSFAEDPYPTVAPAHLLHFILRRVR